MASGLSPRLLAIVDALPLRVGVLDGRHPEAGVLARSRIAAALTPQGRLFVDGGDPLPEVSLVD